MRFIVYGVGAIGGTIAAALARSGQEVVGIARGPMLDAIRERGLLLRTPGGAATARFPCHADPAEIDFTTDDVILLAMKTQDTEAALMRLRDSAFPISPFSACRTASPTSAWPCGSSQTSMPQRL